MKSLFIRVRQGDCEVVRAGPLGADYGAITYKVINIPQRAGRDDVTDKFRATGIIIPKRSRKSAYQLDYASLGPGRVIDRRAGRPLQLRLPADLHRRLHEYLEGIPDDDRPTISEFVGRAIERELGRSV